MTMLDTAQTDLGAAPFHRMPEPRRPSFVGHLPEWLGLANAKSVLQRLLHYAEECGPVARVTLGPVKLVLISDAEIATSVLEDARANFKGAAYILTRAVLDNVLLLNGAEWQSHRKTFRAALRDVDILRSANIVSAQAFVGTEPKTVMLDKWIYRTAANVVGHFVGGVELDDAMEPHRARIQYELAGLGIDLQCQPWMYLDPNRWIRLRQSVAASRRFFRAAVDKRLARPRPELPDILNGFLRLAREGLFPNDPDALADAIQNFFFTAHDVLASSTTFCLHLLARHPSIQARLRAELSRVPGKEFDRRSLDECELLGQVIRESLRLYPGYALFGRTVQKPMPIGGFLVPRGTLLIVSPYVIHRLERHFDHAAEFDPDRFAGLGRAPILPTARDGYMPFGAGSRGCLASHLALPIMKTMIAHCVRKNELRVASPLEPRISYWGTAYVEEGLPVQITRAALTHS